MTGVELVKWLEEKLDKLDTKLDGIKEDQAEIRRVQAEQAKDIAHHIKRTDELQLIVEPLKEHLARLRGIAWFLGAVGATVAAIIGVLEYLKP